MMSGLPSPFTSTRRAEEELPSQASCLSSVSRSDPVGEPALGRSALEQAKTPVVSRTPRTPAAATADCAREVRAIKIPHSFADYERVASLERAPGGEQGRAAAKRTAPGSSSREADCAWVEQPRSGLRLGRAAAKRTAPG